MQKKTPSPKSALAPTRARLPTNKCTKKLKWTKEEDELLFSLVDKSDPINWHIIASNFPNKTTQQVSERWEKVLNPELKKGTWTREEDETIINFVKENGCKNWTRLSALLPGRIGKQCRERWRNHLDPNIIHTMWSTEEDLLLIKLHSQYGNSWVKISSMMPGRSDNAIKNRWNSTLKKVADVGQTVNNAAALQQTITLPFNINQNQIVAQSAQQVDQVQPNVKQEQKVDNKDSQSNIILLSSFQNVISPELQKVQGQAPPEPEHTTDTSPRVTQSVSVESNRQKFLVLLEREETNDTA